MYCAFFGRFRPDSPHPAGSWRARTYQSHGRCLIGTTPRCGDPLAVRALEEPLDNKDLEELLTGPIGGADPVGLRRLIRALRRWNPEARGMDMLREILASEEIEES